MQIRVNHPRAKDLVVSYWGSIMSYSRWYDVAGFITCSTLSGNIIETNTSLAAVEFKWILEFGTFFFIFHFVSSGGDDD